MGPNEWLMFCLANMMVTFAGTFSFVQSATELTNYLNSIIMISHGGCTFLYVYLCCYC